MSAAVAGPWIGIDVANTHLDIARLPGTTSRVPNTSAGWATLVAKGVAAPPAGIVLEATGPYHRGLTVALAAAGIAAAVINPSWIKAFARSTGRRAKTDRSDAQRLACYGQRHQPTPTPVPTETARQLRDLAAYREDLVAMRTMEKNRRAVADPIVEALIAAHIAILDGPVRTVEARIAELIAADPFWTERVAILTSVPGLSNVLGPQVAVGLIELGDLSRRTIASLAGLAPHPQQRGYQAVSGGRPAIRRARSLMALTAIRHDPVMTAHYQQLLARGKKKKVAMIACAQRMLGILNAMVRDGLTWDQTQVGQGQFLPKEA